MVAEENPSKGSTSRNRTVSFVLLPCPGSVTVMIADPLFPERKETKGRSTVTAGSVLSGRGLRRACGSAGVFRTVNWGCFHSHSSLPTSIPVHSLRMSFKRYAAPERSEIPKARLFEAKRAIMTFR